MVDEDMCIIANKLDSRLVAYSKKQTRGLPLNETDNEHLVDVYYDHCGSKHKERVNRKQISLELNLVTFSGECRHVESKDAEGVRIKGKETLDTEIIVYCFSSIGFIWNVIALSIFCRPSFVRKHHISYYCIARCVYDILMLIFCVQRASFSSHKLVTLDVRQTTESDFKTLNAGPYVYTVHFALYASCFLPSDLGTILLTLAISIERLISVVVPLKAKSYLTHSVARKVTIGIVLLAVFLPGVCSIVIYFIKDNSSENYLELENQSFMYFTIVWTVVVIFIPWVIMLVSTGKTILALYAAKKKREEMASAASNSTYNQTLVMAMFIVVSFLIALLSEILISTFAITELVGISEISTNFQLSIFTYATLSVKSCMNFLACFVSNREFRQYVLEYFRCACNRTN